MTEEKSKSGLVKGLGIGGLVLGIIALVVSFIPCFGIYALYIGILAIIISVIGLVLASKQGLGKGLLIAAIIISIIGCGIAYWQYSVLTQGLEELEEASKELQEQVEEELGD